MIGVKLYRRIRARIRLELDELQRLLG